MSRHFGIPPATIRGSILKWIKTGTVYDESNVGSKPRSFSPEIHDAMVNPKQLEAHRYLSLKQRCTLLWKDFGLHISPHGLTNVYKRAGIGYRRCRAQTRRILDDPDLQSERKKAAIDVMHLMASSVPVIYLDETSLFVSKKISKPEAEVFNLLTV